MASVFYTRNMLAQHTTPSPHPVPQALLFISFGSSWEWYWRPTTPYASRYSQRKERRRVGSRTAVPFEAQLASRSAVLPAGKGAVRQLSTLHFAPFYLTLLLPVLVSPITEEYEVPDAPSRLLLILVERLVLIVDAVIGVVVHMHKCSLDIAQT